MKVEFRGIAIGTLINSSLRMPDEEEFEELQENDRKRLKLASDLKVSEGMLYNSGKSGVIDISKDVLPYDSNRVKLVVPIDGVDYINASWLQKAEDVNLYDDLYDFLSASDMNIILTQDPTVATKQQYLQMIHEQSVNLVVHVGSDKNLENWENDSYGNVSVDLVERLEITNFITRDKLDVYLKRGKSTIYHSVTVIHYTRWPENNEFNEEDSRSFLNMISFVRQEIGKPRKRCTLVAHDAAGGVEGASAFIVLYKIFQEFDSKTNEAKSGVQMKSLGYLNLFSAVNNLREKRKYMIRSFSTYKFLFTTLSYYATKKTKYDSVRSGEEDLTKYDYDIFDTYYDEYEDFSPVSSPDATSNFQLSVSGLTTGNKFHSIKLD